MHVRKMEKNTLLCKAGLISYDKLDGEDNKADQSATELLLGVYREFEGGLLEIVFNGPSLCP